MQRDTVKTRRYLFVGGHFDGEVHKTNGESSWNLAIRRPRPFSIYDREWDALGYVPCHTMCEVYYLRTFYHYGERVGPLYVEEHLSDHEVRCKLGY